MSAEAFPSSPLHSLPGCLSSRRRSLQWHRVHHCSPGGCQGFLLPRVHLSVRRTALCEIPPHTFRVGPAVSSDDHRHPQSIAVCPRAQGLCPAPLLGALMPAQCRAVSQLLSWLVLPVSSHGTDDPSWTVRVTHPMGHHDQAKDRHGIQARPDRFLPLRWPPEG